jgi:antitoxin component of RelBE/YafQ-DinJ toxin-antitoxin module
MPKPKIIKDERRLAVKLEADLHSQAHKQAQRQGLTLSDVIRRLLSKWLKGEVEING